MVRIFLFNPLFLKYFVSTHHSIKPCDKSNQESISSPPLDKHLIFTVRYLSNGNGGDEMLSLSSFGDPFSCIIRPRLHVRNNSLSKIKVFIFYTSKVKSYISKLVKLCPEHLQQSPTNISAMACRRRAGKVRMRPVMYSRIRTKSMDGV